MSGEEEEDRAGNGGSERGRGEVYQMLKSVYKFLENR